MPNIRRRIEGLEGHVAVAPFAPGWTREEIAAKVLDEIDFALATNSPVSLSEGELDAVGARGVDELPGWLQPLVRLVPPDRGEVRHRYKDPPPFEGWRDKVRRHEEGVRAFVEASKQEGRELLEKNRASVGLPPLTPEQVARCELEGTCWGGGGLT